MMRWIGNPTHVPVGLVLLPGGDIATIFVPPGPGVEPIDHRDDGPGEFIVLHCWPVEYRGPRVISCDVEGNYGR